MDFYNKRTNRGHTYLSFFKKNILIIYRHFLFEIDLTIQEPFVKQDNLSIVKLNDELLDKCCDSYFSVDSIKHNLKHKKFSGFALLDGSFIIGYITFCFPPYKTSQYKICNCKCYIDNIWIDNINRGKHLSMYLFKYCFDYLRQKDINKVSFVVRRNNIPMLRISEHLKAKLIKRTSSIRFCGFSIWSPRI